MASFHDLPDDVKRHILHYCPQRVVYSLLKSNTVAKIAYSVLFENVVLEEFDPNASSDSPNYIVSDPPNYVDKDLPNYVDTDALSVPRADILTLHPAPSKRAWVFNSAKELISFYRSHPLFVPHTLIYSKNADVAEIEKLKPGFLSKFEYLSYEPVGSDGSDEIVFDVSPFKHKSFVLLGGSESHLGPKHIETLLNVNDDPDAPMPSVKKVTTKVTFDGLEDYPNIKTFIGSFDGKLDTPSLRKLTITAAEADLSELSNLKSLSIEVRNKQTIVGYSDSCTVRLPDHLYNLSVKDLWSPSQVLLEGRGESLKELEISFGNAYGFIGISKFIFPPNIIRLIIANTTRLMMNGHSLQSSSQKFPESIETLTLSGIDLKDPVFPPGLKVLNLIDCGLEGVDLRKLNRLLTVRAHECEIDQLPLQIEKVDYQVQNGKCIVNDFNKLTDFKVLFDGMETAMIEELVIHPSMKTLDMSCPCLNIVTGGENLTSLRLGYYTCSKTTSLSNLKSLRMLTLQDQRPDDDFDLNIPSLPSSLEALILIDLTVPGNFTCPESIKYLKLKGCFIDIDSSFTLNDNVEVVYLSSGTLEADTFFKHSAKSLKSVYIEGTSLGVLEADFTETDLQRFVMNSSKFRENKVKFPKGLKVFRMYDNSGNYKSGEASELQWADFSLCSDICEFTYRNVSTDRGNRDMWQRFTELNQI